MMSRAGKAARTTMDQARDHAHETRDDVSRNVARLVDEQPLALAIVDLAFGATIAALLPPSRAENRLMGQTSDDLKGEMHGSVEWQVVKVREVAGRAAGNVSEEFRTHGSTQDEAVEATRKATGVVKEIGGEIKSEARQEGGKLALKAMREQRALAELSALPPANPDPGRPGRIRGH